MKLLFWLTLATSLVANAGVFSEDFNSISQKDSSTLVWNYQLGYLHPQLQISTYSDGIQPVASSTTVSVGDGSDGVFDSTTYTNFGTVIGNQITIDASQFPVLNVSRFHLDSTKTLSVINGPLVIRSLSTVLIDGTIDCTGGNGSVNSGAAGGAGGIGKCGGRNGGTGGGSGSNGLNGAAGSANPGSAGSFANVGDPGSGGGGGGGFRDHFGQPGDAAGANTGGTGGAQLVNIDHGFFILDGSAGGGGGSGSVAEGGGGGGAGGGTVLIHAIDDVTISATGSILADGGNGGSANFGGGGGAGAGGNVKVFTTGAYTNDTIISVNPGSPGVPTNPTSGDGGQGSRGRTWIRANAFPGSGTETDGNTLAVEGSLGYVSGTVQTATSKSFDTTSEYVIYQSATANPADPDVILQVAGSSDNFASDDSGWINASAISTLSKKRYIKFRININNSNFNNPTTVDDVTITYTIQDSQENFTFKSSGCGIVKTPPPNNLNWILCLMLLIPLLIALRLRKPRTVRVQARK